MGKAGGPGGKKSFQRLDMGRGDLQEDSLQGLALYALGVARLSPYRSCHLSKGPGPKAVLKGQQLRQPGRKGESRRDLACRKVVVCE